MESCSSDLSSFIPSEGLLLSHLEASQNDRSMVGVLFESLETALIAYSRFRLPFVSIWKAHKINGSL